MLGLKGLGEEIALTVLAADRLEALDLQGRFNALSDDIEFQG